MIELVQDRLLPDCRRSESAPQRWWWVRIVFFWGGLLQLGVHCGWGQWTEPVLVDSYQDSTGINVWGWDWCPFITGEGQVMYLASDRGPGTDFDLYVSTWDGQEWSDPVRLPFCQEGVDERNPTANANNDTLYFISIASGGWDIFWSFRNGSADTSWATPQRMPEPINSDGVEFSVCVTPDNQRLLFSSARPGGEGGEDIYQSRRDITTETGWGTPTLLLGALNTWRIESYPTMSLDTTEIFYWRSDGFLYRSQLAQEHWESGEALPDIINRRVQNFPTETTPFVIPDGHRLYFASSFGSPPTVKDIWFSDRTTQVTPRAGERQGSIQKLRVYPNPFNLTTEISYSLPATTRAELTVYDITGREVAELFNNTQTAGTHTVHFDAHALSSGLYFYRLSAGDYSSTKKMVLLK